MSLGNNSVESHGEDKIQSGSYPKSMRASFLIGLTLTFTMAVASLTGCSKQQELAERQKTLEQLCTSVAQHILDRNPDTIEGSLNQLFHEELTDKCREKLENSQVIPDSPITVLREKEESEQSHKSNKIDVLIVRPLTPVAKDPVSYKVTVKNSTLVNGKAAGDRTYSFTIICSLTPDMDGCPRVVDVDGLDRTSARGSASSSSKRLRHR